MIGLERRGTDSVKAKAGALCLRFVFICREFVMARDASTTDEATEDQALSSSERRYARHHRSQTLANGRQIHTRSKTGAYLMVRSLSCPTQSLLSKLFFMQQKRTAAKKFSKAQRSTRKVQRWKRKETKNETSKRGDGVNGGSPKGWHARVDVSFLHHQIRCITHFEQHR